MLEIGWTELLVVGLVALLVVPPKDLPVLLRTVGKYAGQARKMASDFRAQFDQALRESEIAEIRDTMKAEASSITATVRSAESSINDSLRQTNAAQTNVAQTNVAQTNVAAAASAGVAATAIQAAGPSSAGVPPQTAVFPSAAPAVSAAAAESAAPAVSASPAVDTGPGAAQAAHPDTPQPAAIAQRADDAWKSAAVGDSGA